MPDAEETWTAIRTVMMPQDANPIPGTMTLPGGTQYPVYSTVFGGVILSYIDVAGSIAARRAVLKKGGVDAAFVTVAINRLEFKQPVLVGDVVSFQATVIRVGRTSITMKVDVYAERGKETIFVTDADIVYVGVDPATPPAERRPIPLLPTVPPSV
jgi:acyl-CoA thioesterase YciA